MGAAFSRLTRKQPDENRVKQKNKKVRRFGSLRFQRSTDQSQDEQSAERSSKYHTLPTRSQRDARGQQDTIPTPIEPVSVNKEESPKSELETSVHVPEVAVAHVSEQELQETILPKSTQVESLEAPIVESVQQEKPIDLQDDISNDVTSELVVPMESTAVESMNSPVPEVRVATESMEITEQAYVNEIIETSQMEQVQSEAPESDLPLEEAVIDGYGPTELLKQNENEFQPKVEVTVDSQQEEPVVELISCEEQQVQHAEMHDIQPSEIHEKEDCTDLEVPATDEFTIKQDVDETSEETPQEVIDALEVVDTLEETEQPAEYGTPEIHEDVDQFPEMEERPIDVDEGSITDDVAQIEETITSEAEGDEDVKNTEEMQPGEHEGIDEKINDDQVEPIDEVSVETAEQVHTEAPVHDEHITEQPIGETDGTSEERVELPMEVTEALDNMEGHVDDVTEIERSITSDAEDDEDVKNTEETQPGEHEDVGEKIHDDQVELIDEVSVETAEQVHTEAPVHDEYITEQPIGETDGTSEEQVKIPIEVTDALDSFEGQGDVEHTDEPQVTDEGNVAATGEEAEQQELIEADPVPTNDQNDGEEPKHIDPKLNDDICAETNEGDFEDSGAIGEKLEHTVVGETENNSASCFEPVENGTGDQPQVNDATSELIETQENGVEHKNDDENPTTDGMKSSAIHENQNGSEAIDPSHKLPEQPRTEDGEVVNE